MLDKNELNNQLYDVGKLCSVKLKFSFQGNVYEEYIYCVIKEQIRNSNQVLTQLVVDQLTCLEDYLNKKDVLRVERVLEVKNIQPFTMNN